MHLTPVIKIRSPLTGSFTGASYLVDGGLMAKIPVILPD